MRWGLVRMSDLIDLSKYRAVVQRLDTVRANGLVTQIIGLVVESIGPAAQIGEVCEIRSGGRSASQSKRKSSGSRRTAFS